jgi:hypothetical protein
MLNRWTYVLLIVLVLALVLVCAVVPALLLPVLVILVLATVCDHGLLLRVMTPAGEDHVKGMNAPSARYRPATDGRAWMWSGRVRRAGRAGFGRVGVVGSVVAGGALLVYFLGQRVHDPFAVGCQGPGVGLTGAV